MFDVNVEEAARLTTYQSYLDTPTDPRQTEEEACGLRT